MSAFTGISTGSFGPTKLLVGTVANGAAYTTIQAAVTAATSGSTIYIQPGTYTESITWPANVDVQGISSSLSNPAVTITGNQTFSAAGDLAFYGIAFDASSGSIWTVGPSGAGVQNIDFDTCRFENSAGKCVAASSASGSASITAANSNFLSSGDVCLDIANAACSLFNGALSSVTHDGATLGASGSLDLKEVNLQATAAFGVVLADATSSFSSENSNLVAVEPIRFTAVAGASSIKDNYSTSGTNYVSSSVAGPTLTIGSPLFIVGSQTAHANVTVTYITAGSGGTDINALSGYPLTADHGGTGAVTLTDHGVLLGSGTGAITATAVATDGQLLVGSTGADPVPASLTSTGSSLTVTGGAGTLNVDIAAPVSVANGGTGATTLTDHGILLGSGTGALTPTASPTDGQLLIGSTGADPVLASLTSTGSTLTVTGGAGTLNVDIAAPVTVANGGTGATTLTDHGVLLGSGTGAVTPTAAFTDGQLLIGSTGADPSVASLTAGTGITITPGAGSISVASTVSPVAWQLQASSTTLAVNTGYLVSSGAVSLALPATSAVGDIIEVTLLSAATSFAITQGAGQLIQVGSTATTTGAGGSITSTAGGDSLKMVCYAANASWQVVSMVGNLTVV